MSESSTENKKDQTEPARKKAGGEVKLYAALGLLAALGGALYLQTESRKAEERAHTLEGLNEGLPKFAVAEDVQSKATKIVVQSSPEGGDKTQATHVLVKEGETWRLSEPLNAVANQTNVESVLKNLPKLSIKERIARGTDSYAQYDLTEEAATHVTVYEGESPIVEFWAGKSGGRGQMVRVQGHDGVFVLDGYSSFLYKRDTKGWRDLSIVKLDTDKATRVDIRNESGQFELLKEGEQWSGKFKKGKSGALSPIVDFESAKVDDLLRAYKTLNASGFGDGKSLAETGLEAPLASLTVTIDGAKTEILFGASSEGSSRYAKLPQGDQIYTVSSWASDWAFAEESKFKKAKEELPE